MSVSRLGEIIHESLESFPRELAKMVTDYAKRLPVRFQKFVGDGVSEDGRALVKKEDAKGWQIAGSVETPTPLWEILLPGEF